MKTTSYFGFREKQSLNNYDRQVIEYYQEILNLIIYRYIKKVRKINGYYRKRNTS